MNNPEDLLHPNPQINSLTVEDLQKMATLNEQATAERVAQMIINYVPDERDGLGR